MVENLDNVVRQMKSFGELIMTYNSPQDDKDEAMNFIKTRDVSVDGYSIILHYNKIEYSDCYVETLQVLGKYLPFLPFSLVCKIGKRFFGEKYLSLVEVFGDNRKHYCWTKITDKDGMPIFGPSQGEMERRIFEGFSYRLMNPKNVNFY